MDVIIPMGGIAKRMRPHSLYVPKPLIKIAGKPILYWILDEIKKNFVIDSIVFVVNPQFAFINDVQRLFSNVVIAYQEAPLGTAHAVLSAKSFIKKDILIVFPDAIITFQKDFLNIQGLGNKGIIFYYPVDNPREYGVLILNGKKILDMIEKPEKPISNFAIIGVYYIPWGLDLIDYIEILIKKDIKSRGEYQLTDALAMMIRGGYEFEGEEVLFWQDCGNAKLLLRAQKFLLTYLYNNLDNLISPTARVLNSVIGENVYIDDGATIMNSKIQNSIIMRDAVIENSILANSIIGESSRIINFEGEVQVGPFSQIYKGA